MNISHLLSQMAALLLMMSVGFGLYKGKIIDDGFRSKLSWILVNVVQVTLFISSALNSDEKLKLSVVGVIILLSFSMHVLLFAVGWVFTRISGAKREDRGTYNFMAMFGNLAFIGFPIVRVLFGDTALVYAAVFSLPFNLLAFSFGAMMLAGQGKKAKMDIKTVINPPFVASLFAVLLMLLKPAIPAFLTDATTMLSNIYVPCGMLAIGASLASVSFKKVFGDWRLYALIPIKLLLAPVLTYFLFGLFISDPLLLGLCTVMAAMPIAVNATLLCNQHGGNERLASSGVFLSTLISAATIPLVCALLL